MNKKLIEALIKSVKTKLQDDRESIDILRSKADAIESRNKSIEEELEEILKEVKKPE